jgi:hypothetical protein
LEKLDSGAQNGPALTQFLAEHTEALRQYGHVSATWRISRGQRVGPYYRLRYCEGGKRHSLYLGQDAELVEAVRRRLAELQAPRRERLQWQAFLKRQTAQHRRLKAALNGELQRLGLSLKGVEVRGLRQPTVHASRRLASH